MKSEEKLYCIPCREFIEIDSNHDHGGVDRKKLFQRDHIHPEHSTIGKNEYVPMDFKSKTVYYAYLASHNIG